MPLTLAQSARTSRTMSFDVAREKLRMYVKIGDETS